MSLWIESHRSLENHPKLIHLCALTDWDKFSAIGRLNVHWWWCLDYAIDGDLRRFNDAQIVIPMGVAIADAKRVVDSLVEAKWLDREPYFRVHDWWDYIGRFLQVKYKNSPNKWKRIKELYSGGFLEPPLQPPLAAVPNRPNRTTPKRLIDAKNEKQSHLNGNRSSLNRSKEDVLMGRLRNALGEDEMARAGGHWRVDHVRAHPDLLDRALSEVERMIREGEQFSENAAACLEDLVKRWKVGA